MQTCVADKVLKIKITNWTWTDIFPVSSLSPFLIARMFVHEPSWKYSVKLVGS